MKRMVFLAAIALCASAAMAASDNFSRSKLGKKWVVTSRSLYIASGQLQGKSGALGYDVKSASDAGASITVYLNGTDVEYGAIALGDIAGGNNAFVKIQSQEGDGQFEYGAFYVGNNGEGASSRSKCRLQVPPKSVRGFPVLTDFCRSKAPPARTNITTITARASALARALARRRRLARQLQERCGEMLGRRRRHRDQRFSGARPLAAEITINELRDVNYAALRASRPALLPERSLSFRTSGRGRPRSLVYFHSSNMATKRTSQTLVWWASSTRWSMVSVT